MESFSQDPIGFAAGDANLYRYVGNQVTTYVDPTGLWGDPLGIPSQFQQAWRDFWTGLFGASTGGQHYTDGRPSRWDNCAGGVLGGGIRYGSLGTLNALTEPPEQRSPYSQLGFDCSQDFVRAAGPLGVTVPIYHGVYGETAGDRPTSRAWAAVELGVYALPLANMPIRQARRPLQLPMVDPIFVPNGTLPEIIYSNAARRGFHTARNEAIFWSGLPIENSQNFARTAGGRTLEMTAGGQYLDNLQLLGPNSPLTLPEALQVWAGASRDFARFASGQVRAVTGAVKPTSQFRTIELPELLVNPEVHGIDILPLKPSIGIR